MAPNERARKNQIIGAAVVETLYASTTDVPGRAVRRYGQGKLCV
jgi:hypothetical protein